MTAGPQAAFPGPGSTLPGPLAALARIRRPAVAAGERCEMCAEEIDDGHRHVVDLRDRGLLCTCRACSLLFTNAGAAGGRYRSVPDRYQRVVDFAITAAQWDALQIPVSVAFFFRNSQTGRTAAFFPSPAGATECLLPLEVWGDVEATNPVLGRLEPDTEALLLRAGAGEGGTGPAPTGAGEEPTTAFEAFTVPIDACYELIGHLRARWRGFDGGQEAHAELAGFFDGLRRRGRETRRTGDGG